MPRYSFYGWGRERVLVTDIDGVIADTATEVLKRVNHEYGVEFDVKDINNWHWVSETIAKLTGSVEEGRRAEETWFDPEVMAQAQPIPGAQEFLNELAEKGWILWAATARKPNAREMTLDWIETWFPQIGADRVCIREREEDVSSADIKLAAIGMLGANLFTEDDHLTVRHVADNWQRKLVIAMFNRGWNEDEPGFDEFRVDDWNGVREKAKMVE